MTRPASSQVMSPNRAPRMTNAEAGVDEITGGNGEEVSTNVDQATQRLAESVEFARTFAESGQVTTRDDAVLSHDEAEHLIRSLAGIPGGRPLIRVLLEGLGRHSQSVAATETVRDSLQPPPSDPGSDGGSHDEPRQVDRQFADYLSDGSYDDRELVEYTKALRNSAPIQLPKLYTKADYKAWKSEVPLHFEPRTLGDITYGVERYNVDLADSLTIQLPKLYTKADYKAWKSEVPLHFEPRTLGDITYGVERYNVDLGLRRPKYVEWYLARKNKAFSALALSLSVDLRSTFKIDELRDNMEAASILWAFITKHFEAGDGINPDYLLRDLMMRMLQPKEKVDAYAEDIEMKVTKLRQAKGEFEEWQQVSLLLSNSVLVFPDVTREYANWLNDHDRKTLKLAAVLQRLRAAEHQRQQLESQAQPAVRTTAQVALVTTDHNRGRKRNKQQRKRGKSANDKKARMNCGNCGGDGHWWRECTQTTGKPLKPELERRLKEKTQGRPSPTSLVNSVRVVQVAQNDVESRGLFAGHSLTTPSNLTETVDLTGQTLTTALSPVYSATTPASDEEGKAQEPQLAVRESSVAPTQMSAETQVQQALQKLVETAVQSQWEGVQAKD
ncbi:Hypothetical protein PHPALM_426 [Phytophthora palmivora]|uniref:CCHC-type domain-containing protein n=1 Tax=Phytophthora palmivora TaxID=4796 RepID=A0A2P4YUV1_9STRA|nr:Hypothetical protein PHPALM_426 [Phytophthora palmivora]